MRTSIAVAAAVAAALVAVARADTPTGVAAAKDAVEAARAEPKFVAPGPPLSAAVAFGDLLFSIPARSDVPSVAQLSARIDRVAERLGVPFVRWPTRTAADRVAGVAAARARGASAIMLLGGLHPAALRRPLALARARGIAVTSLEVVDARRERQTATALTVGVDYERAGRLLADYAIWRTKGELDAVVLVPPPSATAAAVVAGVRAELARRCAGCRVAFVRVPGGYGASTVELRVAQALRRDRALDYVIALDDLAQAPFADAAIRAAGAVGRVKVLGFGAAPAVLRMVREGDVVEADVGASPDWIAYAALDQELRIMVGLKPAARERVPLRLFDRKNAGDGFGDDYVDGYERLWGAK